MSASDFSIGLPAVPESHFGGGGGGAGYFSQQKKKQPTDAEQHAPADSDQPPAEQETEPVVAVAEPEFEPTYEIPGTHEHHPHIGRLLDVKM